MAPPRTPSLPMPVALMLALIAIQRLAIAALLAYGHFAGAIATPFVPSCSMKHSAACGLA
jgi:hypothetical protein